MIGLKARYIRWRSIYKLQSHRLNQGFTLVEISMVLVIIGLITAGIVVGREMIRNAQVRSETSNFTSYQVAYQTFISKYNCMPGDCSNASNFWPGTYNGNGDKAINWTSVGTVGTEYVASWNHLSRAKLIKNDYDGILDADNYYCSSTTCPASVLNKNITYWLGGVYDQLGGGYWGWIYGSPLTASNNTGLIIASTGTPGSGGGMSFSVQDASQIDLKIDDGDADKGRVMTINESYGAGSCISGNDVTVTDGSANYQMGSTTDDCLMFYVFR